jgi:hypothetical protein
VRSGGWSAIGPLLLAVGLIGALVTINAGRAASNEAGAGVMPAPDLSAYPWLYRRAGADLDDEAAAVELIAVGDVMSGRGVAQVENPFAAVASWLQAADIALGNLESPLVAGGTARALPTETAGYTLAAPPTAAGLLASAGFDALGLANNHALDYGPAGLAETMAYLERAGVTPVGAGLGESAYAPKILTVGGLRVGLLAFTDAAEPPVEAGDWRRAGWDEERALQAIATTRATADIVIVAMHWGYEYEERADPRQKRLAQLMADAGADLIMGHHPHVVQEVAVESGAFVAYSLGNFLFDQDQGRTGAGLALRVLIDEQGLLAVQALPIRSGPRPRLMSVAEASPLLSRLTPAPRRVGFACEPEGCATVAVSQGERQANFSSGEIDLTGDGVAELIQLAGHELSIAENGQEVWRSPGEWQVVDVALGDPNDDGRGELMLAILRPDPDGFVRSQPYIVGHRGGRYDLLWGGRPVRDTIVEVELGDIDGDLAQELVVIEEGFNGQGRSITVWRWQGWTFSLGWRSPAAHYRDLALESSADGRLVISAVQE